MDFDDDAGFIFFLPWPVTLLVLIVLLIMAIWWWHLSPSEKLLKCQQEALVYGKEGKYMDGMGCVIKIDETHWQKTSKYEKSGIIEVK